MLSDAVVDTNVFDNCQNPGVDSFEKCKAFLIALRDSSTKLCVDEGFSLDGGQDKSFIGYEYRQHIRFGSLPYAVLVVILTQQRLRELPKRPTHREYRKINQMIRNKRDRVFLGVACNSYEKVLVSEDTVDFQPAKRTSIKKDLDVRVLFTQEAAPLVS